MSIEQNAYSDVSIGVFVATAFVGAFAFGIGYDLGVTAFWDKWNQGVSKLSRSLRALRNCHSTETMERYPT